ncbi:MAG: hypothetical protein A3K83_07765 [Omnitrophica WOR_2 bacterium RBG_13_44_8b]|nr:MAG: hypothetical protein A3K83_07765 [Omnitrophica WOR_2 bacterium RBG_13_44_8b]
METIRLVTNLGLAPCLFIACSSASISDPLNLRANFPSPTKLGINLQARKNAGKFRRVIDGDKMA